MKHYYLSPRLKHLTISLATLLGLCGSVAIFNEKLQRTFPHTRADDISHNHHKTRALLIHHNSLSKDAITPMNYTVTCGDDDRINARVDELKGEYHDRWEDLTEAELQECLQKIANIIAPRYLPFIAYRYKNYQFIHEENSQHASYYAVQAGPCWMSSLEYRGDVLISTLEYPPACNGTMTLDEAIIVLAHEMVHQARMHPTRIHIHEDLEATPVIDIPAEDFLKDVLHITPIAYAKSCNNLSQYQECEADYCSLIALQSIDATKDFILYRLREGHGRSHTHPSSIYRVQLGIEYWIRFVMERDAVDYKTAHHTASTEYQTCITTSDLPRNLKRFARTLINSHQRITNNNNDTPAESCAKHCRSSHVAIFKNDELPADEIIPVDYTVICGDDDGINEQLDTLKAEYDDRWIDLTTQELQECLQKIADTLAPRYFPFITYRYKNYQFIQEASPQDAYYYAIQTGGPYWFALASPQKKNFVNVIEYESACNHIYSLETAIIALTHEMVHQARMHTARPYVHEDFETPSTRIVNIPTDDFLCCTLNLPSTSQTEQCRNLSQYQECEADYCSLIALRSIDATKNFILHRLRDGHKFSDTHPSSIYRVQLGIEYWIRFVMEQDHLDRTTACQRVGASYRSLLAQAHLTHNARKSALSLSPDLQK